MKKNKIISSLMVIGLFVFVFGTAFAASANFPTGSGSIGNIETGVKTIWGTVTTIVQMLAFGAILFAGLRYMFASADKKADIKSGLVLLVIGAILVFASSTVVKFVVDAANQIGIN